MKTSIRLIAIFIVLTFVASDFASGQSRVNNQNSIVNEPVPQPSQPRATTGESYTPPWPGSSSEPLDQQRQLFDTLANFTISTGTSTGISTGSENILVIPTGEIGIEELLTINEDMNVMSKIFANELGRQRIATTNVEWSLTDSRWVPTYYDSILGRSTGNTVSSIYLQGYGALFMMEVDFPLSGPPETQEQKDETEKEDVDKVWEQTRQQIYQPQVRATTSTGRRVAERPEVKYDAQRVENLKTTLIQSLKHAANIRALGPDESVIIRIVGSGISDRILSIQALTGTDNVLITQNYQGETITKIYEGGLPDDIKFSSPTVLIIRTERSDIDAFAKGDLDIDQFREKVQILSYPLVGGNAGRAPVSRTRSTGRATTAR